MKRPTIPDVAKLAGVSVASVNRVLSGKKNVRQKTKEQVYAAAKELNFYALSSIEQSISRHLKTLRLGIILQQSTRGFYKVLAENLHFAANSRLDVDAKLTISHLDDLTAENFVSSLHAMSENCDVIAIVAPQHPLISSAIEKIVADNVPIVGLITPLNSAASMSYIGLDHWQVGRTAAWAFDMMVKSPGKIGVLVGNHRYRNQELNESGFRSYFREHNENFTILEPQTTYESSSVAREITEKLLLDNPDMCGLFVSGGGITGAVTALRQNNRRNDFVTIGYDLFDFTREALLDRSMQLIISHPMKAFASDTIDLLINLVLQEDVHKTHHIFLPFELYTPENV